MAKKILGIDMDGVIADLALGMYQLDPDLPIGDGPNWEQRAIRFNEVCQLNKNIFRNLPLIEGAQEAIDILAEYFDIYFVSTPMWSLKESFTDKALWLDEHFGAHAEDRLILTKHKDLFLGDYLIDDTVRNGVRDFTGEHIWFGKGDTKNWKGVVKYLVKKEVSPIPIEILDFTEQ